MNSIICTKRLLILFFKFMTIIGLAVFIVFSGVSCNIFKVKETKTQSTEETEATTAKESQKDNGQSTVIEINIWDSTTPKERIALMDSIEKFMVLNKEIKIESRHFRSEEELIDQFEASSLAGSGPEILLSSFDSAQRLASSSAIRNVDSMIDFNEIIDGLVEISNYSSKKYIIPFRATDFLMLFYNKSLVESVPSDLTSLIEYCKKVSKSNKPKEKEPTYGFLLNSKEPDWIIPFIGSYQDWIVDYNTNSITLNTQSTQKTLEFLVKIYNEEKILPYGMEYEEINNSFKNGKAHMIINGIWAIDEYKQEGINFGVSKIPILSDGYNDPTPLINGTGFMINVNCYDKELEASQGLIKYLLSADVQAGWTFNTQTMPVLKNMSENHDIQNDPIFLNAFEQEKICRGMPGEKTIRVIRDAIRVNLENVIKGNITPQDATVKIQEDAIKLISDSITIEKLNNEESTSTSKT